MCGSDHDESLTVTRSKKNTYLCGAGPWEEEEEETAFLTLVYARTASLLLMRVPTVRREREGSGSELSVK